VVGVKIPEPQKQAQNARMPNFGRQPATLTSDEELELQIRTAKDDDLRDLGIQNIADHSEDSTQSTSYEQENKPRGILRSQSAHSRADMLTKDSLDLARHRVQSAGTRKRSIRWNSDLLFNDGTKRPMPKTPGFVNPARQHHQKHVSGSGIMNQIPEREISTHNGVKLTQPQPPRRATWNVSQSKSRINSGPSNLRRGRSTSERQDSNRSDTSSTTSNGQKSRIIQEAIERGYAQQHIARKQYANQNGQKSRPSSGRPNNSNSSFQRLVRPTQQQPALPNMASNHSNSQNLNSLDPRRTPTDQDIVQLWQTMRNVLNYNNDDHGSSRLYNEQHGATTVPTMPPMQKSTTNPNFGQGPRMAAKSKNNPTSLSIEEQRLVQSLDRLNSRLYEIENTSGSGRREGRY